MNESESLTNTAGLLRSGIGDLKIHHERAILSYEIVQGDSPRLKCRGNRDIYASTRMATEVKDISIQLVFTQKSQIFNLFTGFNGLDRRLPANVLVERMINAFYRSDPLPRSQCHTLSRLLRHGMYRSNMCDPTIPTNFGYGFGRVVQHRPKPIFKIFY